VEQDLIDDLTLLLLQGGNGSLRDGGAKRDVVIDHDQQIRDSARGNAEVKQDRVRDQNQHSNRGVRQDLDVPGMVRERQVAADEIQVAADERQVAADEIQVAADERQVAADERQVAADEIVNSVFKMQRDLYNQEADTSMRDVAAYRAMIISSLGSMYLCKQVAGGTDVEGIWHMTETNARERVHKCSVKMEHIIQHTHFSASQHLEDVRLEIMAAMGVVEHVGHVQGYNGTEYPGASDVFVNSMRCVERTKTEDALLQPIIDSIVERIRRDEPK
jgi:hypothetical protein